MEPTTRTSTRRAFLHTTGIAGAALAVGAATAGSASAADATTTTVPTVKEGNFTYPSPPQRPEGNDLVLLGFVASIELAAADLYQAVLDTKPAKEQAIVLEVFRTNHKAQAATMNGLTSNHGVTRSNPTLLKAYATKVVADPLGSLRALEESLVATMVSLLGQLKSTDAGDRVAAVLTSTSRQAVVLAQMQNAAQSTYLPSFEQPANALTMAQYPVERV